MSTQRIVARVIVTVTDLITEDEALDNITDALESAGFRDAYVERDISVPGMVASAINAPAELDSDGVYTEGEWHFVSPEFPPPIAPGDWDAAEASSSDGPPPLGTENRAGWQDAAD